MARVTVEDCLERVPNRFALTVLAARRARALSESRGTALVQCDNKVGVTALREIGKDRVRWHEDVEETLHRFIDEQKSTLMRGSESDHTFIDAVSFSVGGDGEDGDGDEVEELSADLEKLGTGNAESDDDDGDEKPEGEDSVVLEGDGTPAEDGSEDAEADAGEEEPA